MASDKREKAIKYLTEEIRSLRMAPQINGCGPENWAEQLEVMETCLQAVRSVHFADAGKMQPLTLEQLREMVDKPAYLYIYDTALRSGWDIIKAVTKDKIIFRGWNTVYVPISSLGKRFDLYAYPPAHIDREAWETCEWCGDLGDSRYKLYAGFCMQKAADDIYEEETEKLNYCPKCGRPLTEEAWARLEKRLCRGSEKED